MEVILCVAEKGPTFFVNASMCEACIMYVPYFPIQQANLVTTCYGGSETLSLLIGSASEVYLKEVVTVLLTGYYF